MTVDEAVALLRKCAENELIWKFEADKIAALIEQQEREIDHMQLQIGEASLKIAEYEGVPLIEVKAWCDGLKQGYVDLEKENAELREALKLIEIETDCQKMLKPYEIAIIAKAARDALRKGRSCE